MADLKELGNFLIWMSENPEQARRFRENPESVIEEANVSEETKDLLRSGRENVVRQIREMTNAQSQASDEISIFPDEIVIVIVIPAL